MATNEWERLTPADRDERWGVYDYQPDSGEPFDHLLRWTKPPRRFETYTHLTDAELDALARHAPGVRALVEAAQIICKEALPQVGADATPELIRMVNQLTAALALFTEADHG